MWYANANTRCLTLQESQQRARLRLEYELHSKITSATLKLSRDRSTNRSIRRQRKECHKQMKAKVRIEIALLYSRLEGSQPSMKSYSCNCTFDVQCIMSSTIYKSGPRTPP